MSVKSPAEQMPGSLQFTGTVAGPEGARVPAARVQDTLLAELAEPGRLKDDGRGGLGHQPAAICDGLVNAAALRRGCPPLSQRRVCWVFHPA